MLVHKMILILLLIISYLLTIIDCKTEFSTPDETMPVAISVIILNQRHHLHEEKAALLAQSITQQGSNYPYATIETHIASKSLSHIPFFTLFPLLDEFCTSKADWFVLVDEYASVDVRNLLSLLREEEGADFIGRTLKDASFSIIHHYDDPKDGPLYPDMRAGAILSATALTRACRERLAAPQPSGFVFSIDPPYELSKWLASTGTLLAPSTRLCPGFGEGCAVTAGNNRICEPRLPVSAAGVGLHVAVKTFSGNHEERLPVLRQTWLRHAPSVVLFSDVDDSAHGTISARVPNSDQGHCAKTLAILRRSLALQEWKWLVVADDDTLLSLPRLAALLACYSASQPLAIGEVYGYQTPSSPATPYPTGGSGMIFSRPLVELISSGDCSCGPADPDDIVIGFCIARLGLPVIHNSDLHQNPPTTYAADRLTGTNPISFHRFGHSDPIKDFRDWLDESPANQHHSHDDL